MAITYDQIITGTVGTGTGNRVITFSDVVLPANSVLTVAAAYNGGSADPSIAVAGGGLTWATSATAVGSGSTGGRASVFTARNASAQTATITVTGSGQGSGAGDGNATLYVKLGADQTDWVGASDTFAANDNNPSNTAGEGEITTTGDGSVIIWAALDWEAGAVTTVSMTNATATTDQNYQVAGQSSHYAAHSAPIAASGTLSRLVIATANVGDWVCAGVEILAGAGSSVTLTPAVITFSGVSLDPVSQPVTVSLVPAVVTFSAVAVDPDPQPVTVNLAPVTVTFSAVPVTPSIPAAEVSLAPAVVTFTAVPVNPVPQPVSVALTPASIAFVAVPVTPVPEPVTVNLGPAVLTFVGVAVTPVPQSVTVSLVPAVITFAAVSLTVAGGQVNVNLQPVVVTFSAVSLTPTPGAVTVNLLPGVVTWTVVPLVPVAGVMVQLVPATVTWVAVALMPVPQPVTVLLVPGVITFVAVPMDLPPVIDVEPREPTLIVVFERGVSYGVGGRRSVSGSGPGIVYGVI